MRGTFLTPMERFQPALPMRGVTGLQLAMAGEELFQPALPMRGVTFLVCFLGGYWFYFNPHSPCGE